MEFDVFYRSVVGYKNILKGKESQDYCKYKKIKGGIICSLADGHSSDFFEYSHIGSKLACDAGIYVLENYIKENGYKLDNIKNDLVNSKIQQKIYIKWLELVNNHFKQSRPVVFRTEYSKYATTLVLALICDSFRLYFNIGDSYILIRKNNKYIKVLGMNNNYFVNSLSNNESYRYIEYYIEEINDENKNDYIILFSDGFYDSFNNYKDMINDLNDTILMYNKNVFSKFWLENNYKQHLDNLSKNKGYDDISIMFIKSI
ncbi:MULTISPECIES: protein phosphatase 2C domain-containing protein [unclassified Romboutsia]|uniref:protein phosphatase 2C domain-containing protein n=1 Tax=unclassified Romboutsia TaxID=2626894 RepID=UPI0008229F67|nr:MULTISPECIES: protein phosphatase 2C domain-containing protein [unclassified Romboutsia]SCG97423.1 Uncharacterised protein [uncultured Clostridium sp.]